MNTPADIWKLVLGLLQGRLQAVTLDAWFDDLTAVEFKDDTLHLHTPDKFKKEIIDERYLQTIKDALRDLFSADINVIVTTGDAPTPITHNNYPEDEYTFEQFIVGSSNKFAHAAATAVANNPAKNYNPLFIYGQSGLGKTHLLYAIANVVRRDHPSFRIIYIKGEDFTNELVNSIGAGQVQEFRDKYRLADLLLVDDIQFVAGKDRTQEEFFHTFNALHSAGKQIILTSDKPPKDMETLEERIRSRFEWGLMADIGAPDYETRMAILRRKVESDDMSLSDDILNYIANNIKSNIRELEGALNKLLAYSNLEKTEITMEIAKKELQNIITPDKPREITPQLIIEVVSEHFQISLDQMISKNRSNEIARPRQIAMYLCKTMTDIPLDSIGSLLGGRDHSTIIHGIKKIADEYDSNEQTRNLIETIKKKINPN